MRACSSGSCEVSILGVITRLHLRQACDEARDGRSCGSHEVQLAWWKSAASPRLRHAQLLSPAPMCSYGS